jgi:hypothetical protein
LNLLTNETIWIFLSGSDDDRFLDDIAFGIQCLLHRGFPSSNIYALVDQSSSPASIFGIYSQIFGRQIFPTQYLQTLFATRQDFKNLVLVVTGHGSEQGIEANPTIKPYPLISLVKSQPGLENALIVLGQCFAGAFNYMDARGVASQDGEPLSSKICIIGATDLTESVSSYSNLDSDSLFQYFACIKAWKANLFLLYFMISVAFPQDIDGDGQCNVMDAYKFAGIRTNQRLIGVRSEILQIFHRLTIDSTVERLNPESLDKAQLLEETAKVDLITTLAGFLSNQSCWILHADLARSLLL